MKTLNTQTKPNEARLHSGTSTMLGAGLLLRTVAWNDLEAVTQLIYDVCAADGDTTVAVTPEELKHQWQTPRFDLERDALRLYQKAGMYAASEFVTFEKELRQGREPGAET